MIKKIENTFSFEHCPFCKAEKSRYIGKIENNGVLDFSTHKIKLSLPSELWKCIKCLSYYKNKIIKPETAYELYSNSAINTTWAADSFTEYKTKKTVTFFNTILSKGKRVLDVGCNAGEFLDYAKTIDCITAGVELCEQSQALLKKKEHSVYPEINQISGTYDIITAFDLVEHLYEPYDFFKTIKKHLNKNGNLIILTGDICSLPAKLSGIRWWYICLPCHIVFPSIKYLKSLDNFYLEKKLFTYASNSFSEYKKTQSFRDYFYMIRKGTYGGLPAFTTDHYLVSLKKTNS